MSEEIHKLKAHFDRRFDSQDARLDRIEKHAERTNGRVTGLELWKARLEGMQAGTRGSWAVFVAGVGTIGTVVGVALSLVVAAMNGG